MRIVVSKITIETVEVELPETCPACNAPLKEGSMIRGFELSDRSLEGYLKLPEDGDISGTEWVDGENEYNVGYIFTVKCDNTGCEYVLYDGLYGG